MTSLRTPVGAELNLRSQMMFLKPLPANTSSYINSALAWNSRYIHECGHWARLHGTTIGVLLTHLRRTRDQLATFLCRSLDAGEVRRISRFRQLGTPILSWQRSLLAECCDPRLAALGEDWLMHRAAYDLLFDPRGCQQALREVSMREAADLALRQAWRQAAQPGILPFPDGSEADVVTGAVVLPTIDSTLYLSTRLLFECASALDELYPMVFGYVWRDTESAEIGKVFAEHGNERMLEATINGEYGLPCVIANQLAGRLLDPYVVHSLIDFALNPPVPGLTSEVTSVDFQELYPPARFVRAAQALAHARLDLENPAFTVGQVEAFHSKLADLTGLRAGSIDCALTTAATPREAVRTPAHITSVMPNTVFTVARNILQERGSQTHRISHFGLNFIGKDAAQFLEPHSDASAHWLHPLLRVIDSEYYWPLGLFDSRDASILFDAIAMSAALDDVLTDVGTLSAEHLPQKALHAAPGAADQLSADLRMMIQLEVGWASHP